MRKILFLTAFPPNNCTAGQNYSKQLLDDISQYNIVDVIYFNYQGHAPLLSAGINKVNNKKNTLLTRITGVLSLLFIHPFFTTRFKISTLLKIRHIASKYDIIYFDFSQVFIYSLFLKHPHKIFMCHDIITQKYSRTFHGFLHCWFIKHSEKTLLNTATEILCFSNKDKDIIKIYFNLAAIVVPFYVAEQITNLAIEKLEQEDYFVFFGAWNRYENLNGLLWFTKNIAPVLSNSRFKIIGGGLSEKIRSQIEKIPNMEYLGFLDDPYTVIAKSKALIAPLFSGAGVKVKVIETLATGTPVIGTHIAFEGVQPITYKNESVLINAMTVDNFITRIRTFQPKNSYDKKQIKELFLTNYSKTKFSKRLK